MLAGAAAAGPVGFLEELLKLNAEQTDAAYMVGRSDALPGGDRDRARSVLDDAIRLSEKEPVGRSKALRVLPVCRKRKRRGWPTTTRRSSSLRTMPRRWRRAAGLLRKISWTPPGRPGEAVELYPKDADSYEAKGVCVHAEGLRRGPDHAGQGRRVGPRFAADLFAPGPDPRHSRRQRQGPVRDVQRSFTCSPGRSTFSCSGPASISRPASTTRA